MDPLIRFSRAHSALCHPLENSGRLRQPSFAVFASDAEWTPAALAIIWNVQSDWQRDDAVETRGSPREEAAGTQQMRSRVPFALRTVQSFFCRAEKESLTGRALVPSGISQRSRQGEHLPWRRFTICSARFRTTMPMC